MLVMMAGSDAGADMRIDSEIESEVEVSLVMKSGLRTEFSTAMSMAIEMGLGLYCLWTFGQMACGSVCASLGQTVDDSGWPSVRLTNQQTVRQKLLATVPESA